MKKLFFVLIILTSCTSSNINKKDINNDINIYSDLTFEQFKNKILYYAKESKFPDIN
tara:strand:+ start:493 stop:663 length:171 start_codon:yes stop_codon:yes gene_type:complete